jgi:tetratricopeptide (TPR) repeat protein
LEEMGYHIRKSLDIYPNYYSGFQMFVGVLAEEYRYDNDLDKLLDGFKRVFLQRDYLEFIDTYLNYLEGQPTLHPRLTDFYYDIGYNVFWRQKRKKAYAIKYLEKGLALNPGHPTIQQALAEVRQN